MRNLLFSSMATLTLRSYLNILKSSSMLGHEFGILECSYGILEFILIIRYLRFAICMYVYIVIYFFFLFVQVIMPTQRWDVKHTMYAYQILLVVPCIQPRFYAQMELFSSNKYSTVIGGMKQIKINTNNKVLDFILICILAAIQYQYFP